MSILAKFTFWQKSTFERLYSFCQKPSFKAKKVLYWQIKWKGLSKRINWIISKISFYFGVLEQCPRAGRPSASKKQQNNPLWTMKAWILTVEVAFIITAIRKKTSRLLRSVGFIRWRPIIIVIYSIIYRVHTRCKFVFAPSVIIGRKLSNSITLWKSTSATIFRLFFHLEKQMIHLL